jgi:hypothetical protein
MSTMNTEQITQNPARGADVMSPGTIRQEEVPTIGASIGTFANSTDFILRFRDGKPIAANTGDQGGGQN